MALPTDWQTNKYSQSTEGNPVGHAEHGDTICIHSLAVVPEQQKKGLGTVLLKSYIERTRSAKVAQRIALLAHDPMVSFYERLGFENMGSSSVTECGGGWNNMVCVLPQFPVPY